MYVQGGSVTYKLQKTPLFIKISFLNLSDLAIEKHSFSQMAALWDDIMG